MYTVHLNVTKLERGTKMSAKNTEITGLWVFGNEAKGGGSEPWEKFLMDWNAAEEIAIIESAGVGANVDIGMEKEGRFWNIKSVVNKGGGGAPQSMPPASPPTAPPTAPPEHMTQQSTPPQQQQKEMFQPPTPAPTLAPTPAPVVEVAQSILELKAVAINKAVDLTIGMMANGILKGAKVTPAIVHDGLITLAESIAMYLEGDGPVDPKSDTSPLQREPGCDDDKGDPGVDASDIPF